MLCRFDLHTIILVKGFVGQASYLEVVGSDSGYGPVIVVSSLTPRALHCRLQTGVPNVGEKTGGRRQ